MCMCMPLRPEIKAQCPPLPETDLTELGRALTVQTGGLGLSLPPALDFQDVLSRQAR